jgi:hypothetical protein
LVLAVFVQELVEAASVSTAGTRRLLVLRRPAAELAVVKLPEHLADPAVAAVHLVLVVTMAAAPVSAGKVTVADPPQI